MERDKASGRQFFKLDLHAWTEMHAITKQKILDLEDDEMQKTLARFEKPDVIAGRGVACQEPGPDRVFRNDITVNCFLGLCVGIGHGLS